MKTLITLFLLPIIASAQVANEIRVQQRNAGNTSYVNVSYLPPAASANGILAYNGSTTLPQFFLLGTGLTFNSGTGAIDATAVAQVNADWNSVSGISQILNKPSLATVAISGAYSDLTGKPTIPSAQVSSDWNAGSGIAQILNRPTLATVATSGNYADLTGTSAVVLTSGSYANPAWITSLAWGKIASTPTTLAGYGITDAATSAALTAGLATKLTIPTGTTAQYVRGDGTLGTSPTAVSAFTNDAGYLTSISSSQVTTALGFTPYNATNPSSYIAVSGARSAISLTTTGSSGVATYSQSTGVLNVPQYANSGGTVTSIIAGTGLSGGTITGTGTIAVNTSQNIATLSNLTGNGFVKTSGSAGTLSVDASTYLTANQTITATGDATGSGTTTLALTLATVATPGTYNTVTVNAKGLVTAGNALTINNSVARSIVTVAAAANGWQISATQNSTVQYPVQISTTSTIGGPSSGIIVCEICSTNSATAANWVEVDRFRNDQTITLAIVLQSIQTVGAKVNATVPAGWFVRVRSFAATGTVTYSTTTTGQEILQ